jgi:hypothetical protein
MTLTYVPAAGENHQILEVPAELASRPLMELPPLCFASPGAAHGLSWSPDSGAGVRGDGSSVCPPIPCETVGLGRTGAI